MWPPGLVHFNNVARILVQLAHTHTHTDTFSPLKGLKTANRTRHFIRNVSFDLCKPQEAAYFLAIYGPAF